ncbi:heterokaryon incompatibility protein [Colletotrichum graminicola]|uniref:Heterokaryon incompatibility protein n=1 Tax=Colletotrichum graminicola (strain M1.001 / M2 / FGSC 10212) TaxID=645133 RepID=E3QWW3_COLGM|nr:heterokaryon incompatibility protein [Colletotrichum graminicola M1.001]EFQ35351.1 heterokaryon incompatibility protein [Colletotrichum graminicola M1.001]WDK22061.1 heterokaryon incompatibility protein [Colletotrichum graminicola]
MGESKFQTTFKYTRLPTDTHIRLLEILRRSGENGTQESVYRIVTKDIAADNDKPFEFEAVSYTWGNPTIVSSLPIEGCCGTIGLTESLTQALPHLEKHSTTGYLWIDQLCIDQSSGSDKAHQVGRMAQIYSAAKRVLAWLGPEDEHSRVCKAWLSEVDKMLRSQPYSHVVLPDSSTFNQDVRFLVVRSTFDKKDTDTVYLPAIRQFWERPWFKRGWIVQEVLRAAEILFLTSRVTYNMQDFADLQSIPSEKPLEYDGDKNIAYDILLDLKAAPYSEDQPIRFLRLIARVAGVFITSELADNLYAFLGMIDGSGFTPDYEVSIKQNFSAFAVALARNFGSLDFLSLWSANLDALLPSTPEELRNFSSWVPSYSGIPLIAPYRLAAGGMGTSRTTVNWNAANGRRHVYDQPEDAITTGRLRVHGRIIDHIHTMSTTKTASYWVMNRPYLDSLVHQIRKDLPISPFQDWTLISLVSFLGNIAANGNTPAETSEVVLGLQPRGFANELADMNGNNSSLAPRLAMARGRKFATTERGRIGMVPWIGSKEQSNEQKGSIIVVLHGCCVPIVLDHIGGNEYKVVGECYIEGVMHGEAVDWEEEEADTFVLI